MRILARHPLGTVLGYLYPEMAGLLRASFVCDDASDAVANLRKLEVGRVQHALTGRRVFEYQQRIGRFRLALHPPLVVSEVNGLVAEGELARILGKYR